MMNFLTLEWDFPLSSISNLINDTSTCHRMWELGYN